MTSGEKECFCSLAAALLIRPDAALMKDLQQDGLRTWLEMLTRRWGGDRHILSDILPERDRDGLLRTLREEYGRLFDDQGEKRISLVESTYKPWTKDKSCTMVFAASKGLVMGDSAVHMLDLYDELSLKVPEKFRSIPDHLVLELEFLSLLYRSARQELVEGFIEDHLDWIQGLKDELVKADAHLFYRKAVELVDLFLEQERKNARGVNYGEKRIH
jgi:TorA maturation chaperone TorD